MLLCIFVASFPPIYWTAKYLLNDQLILVHEKKGRSWKDNGEKGEEKEKTEQLVPFSTLGTLIRDKH